jgi:acyl phosphate:glycerol-3-phosphate acyltransferase
MSKILLILVGYMLGNLLMGHVLAKYFYQQNLQNEGSGNIGARNAGRILGKKAFIITFFGDALKGSLAIVVAKFAGFHADWQLIILFAVIMGHIYPIIHRFRGGKGVSTFIGGILTFDPYLFLLFSIIFIVIYFILRSFTIAGLIAIAALPVWMYILDFSLKDIIVACLLSALIIHAHRNNIIGYKNVH